MANWRRIEVAGRPVEIFEPDPSARFGLLLLPDYASAPPIASAVLGQLLAQHRLACICPHGDRTFWTDRIDPAFHTALSGERFLIEHIAPLFHQRWSLAERSFGLFGFGVGGQGALRLAFRFPQSFPVVAAIEPAIEFQEWYYGDTPLMDMYSSKEHCRQDTALLHIHPTEFPPHIFFCSDPGDRTWLRGCDRLHEKLAALGVIHECDLKTHVGDAATYRERMLTPAFEFLISALERESRRLL